MQPSPQRARVLELEAERRRRLRERGLLAFVPTVSKTFRVPYHLAPVARLYERIAAGERVRAVVNCPPRHGKTELELHAVAWLLRQRPYLETAFIGYSAAFARKKSRRARDLCARAGVPLDKRAKAVTDWRTGCEGGGMWATSVGGSVTGEGFHLLLIDDPVKGRKEAESKAMRESTAEWLFADAITRLHPDGSAIATQTRWHVEDPAGLLIEKGWEVVNLPAINDDGEALWPERYDVAALDELRRLVGEYNWSSLYQGSPYRRGGTLFGEPAYYDGGAPTEGRIFIGVDFAYSKKTKSDYSVAVVMRTLSDGRSYVTDVIREQCQAPQFAAKLDALARQYPKARFFWYAAGTEKASAHFIRSRGGPRINVKSTQSDKFTRAQPTAADWNEGLILLPSGRDLDCPTCMADGDETGRCDEHTPPEWLDEYVGEHVDFTGADGEQDDQVDATVGGRDGARRRFKADSDADDGRFGAACAA